VIKLEHGYVEARVKRLRGARIPLDVVSVGATANLMMAAALARGTTLIDNAAREPHIINLGEYLNAMGAKISGLGTSAITIDGVDRLAGVRFEVIPDYIEAGTFLIAGVITGGEVTIENSPTEQLTALLDKLITAGAGIIRRGKALTVRAGHLRAVNIVTAPYPGFPTDMQAQWMALMCLARGTSVIEENIWENRFIHVSELDRMGAKIEVRGHQAVVNGVEKLSGAPVMVSDLRAGAALVLAGLAASGRTVISRVYHLDRGYERMEVKLRRLGARIRRVAG
jgi:UDP-N-acetylglucosamine 1-carboxyvinyltransferase